MAWAKFLACAVPQFLQSGKEVKLLGLIRELGHWGWLRRQCQVGERGEVLMVQRQPLAKGTSQGSPGSAEVGSERGWGYQPGSGLEVGTGAGSASQGWS